VTLAQSRLHRAVLEGAPLDVEILDSHAHLLHARTPAVRFHVPEAERMIEAMDRIGIDRACISVIGEMEGNEEMLRAVAEHPDRLIGFVLVNPRERDRILPTLERCFEHPGVRGIGEVHPTSYQHFYPITGPDYEPVWEFAAARRVPVLIHSGPTSEAPRCSPTLIGEVARRHPGFPILIGHCGAYDSWTMLDEAIDVALEHEQVHLEISAMARFYGVLEHIVGRLGPDKVVYGSDAPFHDWAAEVAHVACAKLDDDTKARIFGATMKRLLDGQT
jgi:predicted TIM-barrel fold metal-dependent hydrolase